jgi:hypothetical protein
VLFKVHMEIGGLGWSEPLRITLTRCGFRSEPMVSSFENKLQPIAFSSLISSFTLLPLPLCLRLERFHITYLRSTGHVYLYRAPTPIINISLTYTPISFLKLLDPLADELSSSFGTTDTPHLLNTTRRHYLPKAQEARIHASVQLQP